MGSISTIISPSSRSSLSTRIDAERSSAVTAASSDAEAGSDEEPRQWLATHQPRHWLLGVRHRKDGHDDKKDDRLHCVLFEDRQAGTTTIREGQQVAVSAMSHCMRRKAGAR